MHLYNQSIVMLKPFSLHFYSDVVVREIATLHEIGAIGDNIVFPPRHVRITGFIGNNLNLTVTKAIRVSNGDIESTIQTGLYEKSRVNNSINYVTKYDSESVLRVSDVVWYVKPDSFLGDLWTELQIYITQKRTGKL